MYYSRALPTILAILSSEQDPGTLTAVRKGGKGKRNKSGGACASEMKAADDCLLSSPEVHDCQACVYGEVGAPNTGKELTCADVSMTGYCNALKHCMNFCDESIMENCEDEVEALEECLEAGGGEEFEGNPIEEVLECCLDEEEVADFISQIA